MNRTSKGHKASSGPAPVEKVDVSTRHWKLRLVLVIALVVVAVIFFARGVMGLFRSDDGWQTIEASSSEYSCANEFTFQYNIGSGSVSASAESKAITSLYTEVAEKAFRLFHAQMEFDDVNNICYINAHPNEEIVVDEVLYQALETMEESGYRLLYLGPIYETYISLFACADDQETQNFDPAQNEDVAEYFTQVLRFAQDSSQIQIELLGDNTIRLSVSEEYQAFADEWGITSYIDFYWLTNAFITDYMADVMIENGYTEGAISSYDGFSRNLGSTGTSWSYNIYDRVGDTSYPAALMQYEGSISIVRFRDYGQSTLDTQHYYEFEDGEIRTAYIDETDGRDKTSINDLVAYSADDEIGCVDILLQMIPVYIADAFDAEALEALTESGIYSIYCEEQVVYCNDPDVSLTNLYDEDGVTYTLG